MKKIAVIVETKMVVEIADNAAPHETAAEVIQEMEYNFESNIDDTKIINSEIIDFRIVD